MTLLLLLRVSPRSSCTHTQEEGTGCICTKEVKGWKGTQESWKSTQSELEGHSEGTELGGLDPQHNRGRTERQRGWKAVSHSLGVQAPKVLSKIMSFRGM